MKEPLSFLTIWKRSPYNKKEKAADVLSPAAFSLCFPIMIVLPIGTAML